MQSALPLTVTDPAVALASVHPSVLFVVLMVFRTVCLSGPVLTCITPTYVLKLCNRLKVVQVVHTRRASTAVSTHMVKHKTIGYRTNELFVCPPVRTMHLAVCVELAIAPRVRATCPKPAGIRLTHVEPEAIDSPDVSHVVSFQT